MNAFAATMSSLNAEYNIMAGVLTNDVYLRMFNPKAGQKTLMNVARISTVLVGAIMILGAISIRNFGGAFEANKLFTGILAIPVGIPLVMGVVSKKPDMASSIATIIVGIVAGIGLNIVPGLAWEYATLIELGLCLVIYYFPAFLRNRTYSEEELRFFRLVKTPIREEDKPVISPQYVRAMVYLFVFSMVVSGLLFSGMSIPSIDTDGGWYGMLAGIACILGAGVLFAVYRLKTRKTNV